MQILPHPRLGWALQRSYSPFPAPRRAATTTTSTDANTTAVALNAVAHPTKFLPPCPRKHLPTTPVELQCPVTTTGKLQSGHMQVLGVPHRKDVAYVESQPGGVRSDCPASGSCCFCLFGPSLPCPGPHFIETPQLQPFSVPRNFLPSPTPQHQPHRTPVSPPLDFYPGLVSRARDLCHESSRLEPGAEQQYLDTLKQLSKRINPPHRVVNKIDKNEDRKKDLSTMKSHLDIVTDPSKLDCGQAAASHYPHLQPICAVMKMKQDGAGPLKTLPKCDITLEKLKNDVAVAPVVCTQKHRLEDDQRQSTPSVLQGEVARLDSKCMINLDPSHCSNNGTVQLDLHVGRVSRSVRLALVSKP
ncbi:hypothetical protein H8959_012906 [Pygathrix nigripes]